MLNFTVGPVMSSESVRNIGVEQIPYFRTTEFSEIMWENEKYIKKFAKAPENTRVIFVTGSGTASMEATVMNVFTKDDRVLIVNGGSFGQRFVDLCRIHNIPYEEIKLEQGRTLTYSELQEFEGKQYTGFLVNMHETSTGVLYDMNMISAFCKKNKLFLVVDAISSFLADPLDFEKLGIDVMITASQKALACPPGISIIILSDKAVERINNHLVTSMYFDLKSALANAERGQTSFTPAVGILLQINRRLKDIDATGGAEQEVNRIADLANDFRAKLNQLPFQIYSNRLSNAVTPLHPINVSAYTVFTILKNEYNLWICPNGGNLTDQIFRVGHIGALTKEDNATLINAFRSLQNRGLI